MIYLSAEQILLIYARLIEEAGGSHDVRDLEELTIWFRKNSHSIE